MPQFWRVTAVYGLGLVLTEALVLVASDIPLLSGFVLFYAACLLLSLAGPALLAGMSFGRHAGRAAVSLEAWRFALWFATIQAALVGLLLWLAMQELMAEESDGAAIMGVVLFGYVAVAIPLSRYSFGLGARQAARARMPR
ncbi:ABZJ_00895 family protein [Frigidibacter sp. SD6-1]|uniref:ABZJ_00895 family protein n=1 Tax=Frigidibacter sp. SD6-1 TaxID=3032581 RepID=UPI0024DF5447|nr:ABZJ_00895 family protein [Frigidibacter sp. SD6-1]